MLSPTSLVGSLAAAILLSALVSMLGLETQSSDEPFDTIAWAFALSMPVAVLAACGHFGRERWRLPTAGAFAFVFWQLGLAPSMCAIARDAHYTTVFGDDAVVCGRMVHFAWSLLRNVSTRLRQRA